MVTTEVPTPARGRGRLVALAVVLAVLLSSCSWTSGKQYYVHWGIARSDIIIRERTSWDLTLAWDLFHANNQIGYKAMGNYACNGNGNTSRTDGCVQGLLRRATVNGDVTPGWARGVDPSLLPDFSSAFPAVRWSAALNAQEQRAVCLTLSVSMLPLRNPNWTTRAQSDPECLYGEHAF